MKVVANTRTAQGTSASRRLRRADKVPGIIYGGKGQPVAIELEHNPLYHALRKEKFHASILDMELDGKGERVLLRTYQMHPYKPQVLHIDFQRVAEDPRLQQEAPRWSQQFVTSTGFNAREAQTELKESLRARVVPQTKFVELSMGYKFREDATAILQMATRKYKEVLENQAAVCGAIRRTR